MKKVSVSYILKQNADIYNENGKKISLYPIKQGELVQVIATKEIDGKKFVEVGPKQYVKWHTLKASSAKVIVKS